MREILNTSCMGRDGLSLQIIRSGGRTRLLRGRPHSRRVMHQSYSLLSRPERVGQEPEVHERGLYAVAFFVDRSADRVTNHGDFKSLFEEVPEMGLDAQVAGW